MEMRMMVDAVQRDIAGGIEELRVTGGGTRSDFFVQVMADILNRPLVRLKEHQCTALGAAMLVVRPKRRVPSVSEKRTTTLLNLWCDFFNRWVPSVEVAPLGAAGAGRFSSVAQAVAAMVHFAETVHPRAEVRDLLDTQYAIFEAAYDALAGGGVYDHLFRHRT